MLKFYRSVALLLFLASSSSTFAGTFARDAVDDASKRTLTQQIDVAAIATMQKHAVPGMAIVFVRDGKVAYEKGFGVTKITNGTAVGTNTLLKVGSISKPITALAVALLVQDGKLKWDDPLLRHIPELETANPAVARLTIRQILSHQTRLNLDRLEPLLWPQPNQFKFENIVFGLKVMAEDALNTGVFSYSNINYALAGEVVQRAARVSYGDYVQRAIFAPLNMHCVVHDASIGARKSVAQPHMRVDGVTQMVRADAPGGAITEGLDAAAGGVRCDANAMGKWLQFQLNPKASALRLSDALWRDLHTPLAVVRTDFDAASKPAAIETYGLGLQIVATEGEIRYDHYGGVAGMVSYFVVTPSRNSGFAVLMNMSAGLARKEIIDDLSQLMRGKTISARPKAIVPIANEAASTPATPKRKALDATVAASYFGRYKDAWFGEVALCGSAEGAIFASQSSPGFKGKLVGIVNANAPAAVALLWDDKAINSDAIIVPAQSPAARDAQLQGFTLKPLSESDFDFGAMRFRRIGTCG